MRLFVMAPDGYYDLRCEMTDAPGLVVLVDAQQSPIYGEFTTQDPPARPPKVADEDQ